MSKNVPAITDAKKSLPLYVNSKGQVFKFGVFQPNLEGDYLKQVVLNEELPEEPMLDEEELEEDVVPEIPATTAPTTIQPQKDYDALIYALSQQVKDLNEKLSQQAQQPTNVIQAVMPEKKEFGEGVRNITPDDFDERGATFVAYGLGMPVSVYIKDGSEYLAPYNKTLYFKYDSSDRRFSGKEEHYIHFCKYSTKSKKEIAFLRNHPQYNISIFENVKKALNVDPEIVTKMSSATTMIENLRQDNLFARASSLGIDISQGYDKVKGELIAMTYKELMQQEQKQAEKRANDSAAAMGLFSTERAEE